MKSSISALLIPLICLVLTSNVLANGNTNNIESIHYRELCDIYNKIANEPIDVSMKEMMLTENVQEKLPILFDQLFIHIIKSNASNRYRLIKQYASRQNDLSWECEAAHLYYTSEFVTQ